MQTTLEFSVLPGDIRYPVLTQMYIGRTLLRNIFIYRLIREVILLPMKEKHNVKILLMVIPARKKNATPISPAHQSA